MFLYAVNLNYFCTQKKIRYQVTNNCNFENNELLIFRTNYLFESSKYVIQYFSNKLPLKSLLNMGLRFYSTLFTATRYQYNFSPSCQLLLQLIINTIKIMLTCCLFKWYRVLHCVLSVQEYVWMFVLKTFVG